MAQVAPFNEPYSVKNSNVKLNTNHYEVGNTEGIDFINNSHITILPDAIIYRLLIDFEREIAANISIIEWDVPQGAMLFIFSNDTTYTGPYTNILDNEFLSGKFFSDSIVFEYFVPINEIYTGNFIINKLVINKKINYTTSNKVEYKKIKNNILRPKILVTGYWPPTNEMVRHFSQSVELNPNGWEGEDWENSGYDIISFFPEFNPPDCNSCGQGFGDLEVDYQDFTNDFWPIVNSINPVAIITFSRGYNDMSWELENRVVNRTNWYDDYMSPFLPTPNPPDSTVGSYHVRYSSLPMNAIIDDIFYAHLGLDSYIDNTNAGMFLSEYAGYHGLWYKETFQENLNIPCFSAGHIHVGGQIDWDTAIKATEVTLRTLIDYIDQFMIIQGDCNFDGQLNILDVVILSNMILGNIEFTPLQMEVADMDNNAQLNILDIIIIVNIILL